MAAPEGDYWVHHKSLKGHGFDPTNPEQFYTTAFLEVAQNVTVAEGYEKIPIIPWEGHPRANVQTWSAWPSQSYCRYKYLTAMVGSSNVKITRNRKIHGSKTYQQLYPRKNETRVVLVAVDMPTREEQFLWVDMTFPLRAIYFPKRHLAHPEYESHCLYSRLNFRVKTVTLSGYRIDEPEPQGPLPEKTSWKSAKLRAREIQRRKENGYKEDPPRVMRDGPLKSKTPVTLKPDRFEGWGIHPEWTVRFDVATIMNIVSAPDHLLADKYKDPYKYICLYDCRWIDLLEPKETTTMNYEDCWDYLKIKSEEDGMEYDYANNGFDPAWFVKCVGGIALVGVGIVPTWGPLAALAGQLLLDAFTDPEVFTDKYKFGSDRVPVAADTFVASLQESKGFMKLLKAAKAVSKAHLEGEEKQSIRVDNDNDQGDEGQDEEEEEAGDENQGHEEEGEEEGEEGEEEEEEGDENQGNEEEEEEEEGDENQDEDQEDEDQNEDQAENQGDEDQSEVQDEDQDDQEGDQEGDEDQNEDQGDQEGDQEGDEEEEEEGEGEKGEEEEEDGDENQDEDQDGEEGDQGGDQEGDEEEEEEEEEEGEGEEGEEKEEEEAEEKGQHKGEKLSLNAHEKETRKVQEDKEEVIDLGHLKPEWVRPAKPRS